MTKFTIRPFADHDLTNNRTTAKARRDWNYKLSRLRIRVEHAFGMLKGRFPALRRMPGGDLNRIFTCIEALLVIHNILLEVRDDPTDIDDYDGADDLGLMDLVRRGDADAVRRAREVDSMSDAEMYRTGLYRRKLLMEGNY